MIIDNASTYISKSEGKTFGSISAFKKDIKENEHEMIELGKTVRVDLNTSFYQNKYFIKYNPSYKSRDELLETLESLNDEIKEQGGDQYVVFVRTPDSSVSKTKIQVEHYWEIPL